MKDKKAETGIKQVDVERERRNGSVGISESHTISELTHKVE